jgi:DNA polymerase III gamma/tau subunit
MSNEQDTFSDTIQHGELPPALSSIFACLPAKTVEQFYSGYQRWLLQQQHELLSVQLMLLRQQISENEELMRQQQPSAIALAVLARLQSNGVSDVELLDRMLERGEEWLDTTLQLLIRCEQLGMAPSDYTQWCEHALDDAYNWLASMQADDFTGTANISGIATLTDAQDEDTNHREAVTEEMILQKLMSEADEETLELAVVCAPTSHLSHSAPPSSEPQAATGAAEAGMSAAEPERIAVEQHTSAELNAAESTPHAPTEAEVSATEAGIGDTAQQAATETDASLAEPEGVEAAQHTPVTVAETEVRATEQRAMEAMPLAPGELQEPEESAVPSAEVASEPADEAPSAIASTPAIVETEHEPLSEPSTPHSEPPAPMPEHPLAEAEPMLAATAQSAAETEEASPLEALSPPAEHSPVKEESCTPGNIPGGDTPLAVEEAAEYIEVEIVPEELDLPPVAPRAEETEAIEAGSPQSSMAPSYVPAAAATSFRSVQPPRPPRAKKRGFFSQLFSIIFS